MKSSEKAEYESNIIEAIAKSNEQISTYDRNLKECQLSSPDFTESAESYTELDRINGLRAIAVNQRKALQLALARLDRDEYGECVDCGEDIPRARLLSTPTAICCVGCLSIKELTNRKISGRSIGQMAVGQ